MKFEDIKVDMTTGKVSVVGPAEFVNRINWQRVQESAERMVAYCTPELAIKHAVWNQYTAWHGLRTLFPR